MMRRLVLALAAVVALTLGLAGTAGAQTDLGNDGVDMNCADFPELNAAQGYFLSDGGSADRNVDNLDFDGDGNACETGDERVLAGRDTDEQTDDGEDENGETGTLPNTGAGVMAGKETGSLVLVLLGISVLFGVVGIRSVRRA